jgi:hypothetical protein
MDLRVSVAEARTLTQSEPGARPWLERAYRAIPLLSVFFWLAVLYGWQAWRHETPWLWTDELELAQISRSITETGHAARRGDPYGFQTLYAFLIAPAWWLDGLAEAYSTIKYVGVLAMTAAAFPAYFLARTIVSSPAALFAAAGTVAIPSLAYSPMVLEEPVAYPWAALSLFLLVKAFATRGRWWILAAAAATVIAPLMRTELAVLLAVVGLAALFFAWSSDRARRWRTTWTRWDWVGLVVLGIGAVILFSAILGSRSQSWLSATGHYPDRMIEYGLWAAGALTIGLGLLPVVAGLAVLFRPRGEPRTPELRAFTAVFTAALVAFGIYTAVKAAYVSTVFGTTISERNLIYLSPLLFAASALWLERPRLRLLPLAAAVGFVAYLVVSTPFALDKVPYGDALGLSLIHTTNRNLAFDDGASQWALLASLAVAAVLLLAPRLLERRPRVCQSAVAAAAVLVLAWNLAGEISAARHSNDFSEHILDNYPRPLTWLDRATGGRPAVYLGQNIDAGAAIGLWLTEFWNRSLEKVWSLDGTAPGPGPTLTPDLAETDGRLVPDPHLPYAMVEAGIDLAGTVVATEGRWRVYRIRPPLRLAFSQTGIFSDGWTGCGGQPCPAARAAYSRFATPGARAGYVVVTLSRAAARGAPIKPGRTLIQVGALIRGQDRQPHLGRVTAERRWTIDAGAQRSFVIPTPKPPFRVEVRISPTFSPSDYGQSDRRLLGAQVAFAFSLERPARR